MRRLLLALTLFVAACGASASPAETALSPLPPGRWDPQPYVFALGEVNRPGRYVMIAPTTLMQLLVAAGGFTPLAYRDGVEVRRHAYDGRTVIVRVSVVAIEGGKTPDLPLYPGDLVMVTGRYY